MLSFLKSKLRWLDSVSSEVEYWKQIENLQIEADKAKFELQKLQKSFKHEQEYSCFMALRVTSFENDVERLKSELSDSKAAYSSLLKDYFEKTDSYREFKRESLAKIEELQSMLLPATKV